MTDNAPLRFTWIGGATWILELGGVRIGCDPVLCRKGTVQDYGFFRSERLEDPALTHDCDAVDLWLLSHHHEDHLDEAGLAGLAHAAYVLCPARVGRMLRRRGIAHRVLGWGEGVHLRVRNVAIGVRAGPAIHGRNALVGALVGNGNGYLLDLDVIGQPRSTVYVSGDDVFAPERAGRWLPRGLDLAIVNAGAAHVGTGWLGRVIGRITNDSGDLRCLTKTIEPRVLIATHWGAFAHYLERAPAPLTSLSVTVGETVEIVRAPGDSRSTTSLA